MRFLITILCFLSSLSGYGLVLTESELRGWSPLNASILSSFTRPPSDESMLLTIFPPQNKQMHRSPIHVRYMKASNNLNNRLMFLIAGTGSNGNAGVAKQLAYLANQQGIDVIILPNPFTVEFQNSFSHDGLLGSPQKDSRDLEKLVQGSLAALNKLFRKTPSKIYVTGFSLGGLHVALLAKSSMSQMFDKFLILNPTIDFVYGIKKVDEYIAFSDSELGIGGLDVGDLAGIVLDEVSAPRVAMDSYQSMSVKDLDLNTAKNLLGIAFKSKMKKVVNNFSAGDVFDSLHMDDELQDMKSNIGYVSFAKFSLSSLYRTNQAGSMDPDIEFESINLLNFLGGLPNVSKLRYLDNIDDFLKTEAQLSKLLDHAKIKYTVFDGGGHCGNFWTPSFQSRFVEYLND